VTAPLIEFTKIFRPVKLTAPLSDDGSGMPKRSSPSRVTIVSRSNSQRADTDFHRPHDGEVVIYRDRSECVAGHNSASAPPGWKLACRAVAARIRLRCG